MSSIEAALNRAVAEFEGADATVKEFYLLKVQLNIFYYDVAAAMISVGRNRPTGFAEGVALKSLVHSLYEYDLQMSRSLVPRVVRYASERGKPIDMLVVKAKREQWRTELATLRAWKAVRNVATGHYGKDLELQVQLLKSLNQKEVLAVASAFVNYASFIIQLLPHRKRGA